MDLLADGTQGDGCAAAARGRTVTGHYGSKHDLSTFRLVDELASLVADPMCDRCIDKLVVDGVLRKDFDQ